MRAWLVLVSLLLVAGCIGSPSTVTTTTIKRSEITLIYDAIYNTPEEYSLSISSSSSTAGGGSYSHCFMTIIGDEIVEAVENRSSGSADVSNKKYAFYNKIDGLSCNCSHYSEYDANLTKCPTKSYSCDISFCENNKLLSNKTLERILNTTEITSTEDACYNITGLSTLCFLDDEISGYSSREFHYSYSWFRYDMLPEICYSESGRISSISLICSEYIAKNLDPKFCEDIKGPRDIEDKYYRSSCYRNAAKHRGNVSLCELAVPYNYLCYSNLAISSRNLSLCEKVSDPYTKYQCYKEFDILNDSSICDEIATQHQLGKDDCYLDIAFAQKDQSLCNKISLGRKEVCYRRIAIIKNDMDICDLITNQRTREVCKSDVSSDR